MQSFDIENLNKSEVQTKAHQQSVMEYSVLLNQVNDEDQDDQYRRADQANNLDNTLIRMRNECTCLPFATDENGRCKITDCGKFILVFLLILSVHYSK